MLKPLYFNIACGIVALAGVAFGVYEYERANTVASQGPGAPAPLPGQGAPNFVTKATDGNWVVRCPKNGTDNKRCIAVVNVTNKNNQLVVIWMVGSNQQGNLAMTFQAPVGVILKPGLDLVLDTNPPHHLDFGACGPRTCRAGMAIDGKLADEMRKAAKVGITFTLANGRQVTYTVAVAGTDKMLADLALPPAP